MKLSAFVLLQKNIQPATLLLRSLAPLVIVLAPTREIMFKQA
jgi:hypothetical protein